jgi:hypothetical protein
MVPSRKEGRCGACQRLGGARMLFVDRRWFCGYVGFVFFPGSYFSENLFLSWRHPHPRGFDVTALERTLGSSSENYLLSQVSQNLTY